MSCCCARVFKICDLIVCDDNDLVLPIPVLVDGVHTLELDFLSDTISATAEFSSGATTMSFPKPELNEQFTYVGHVKDPAGEIVKFTIDEKEYDCIEFTTRRQLSLTNNQSSSS